MTSCAVVRELLPDYYEGVLPAADTDAARGHLATCAQCRWAFERYTGTLAALRGLTPEVPAGMEARLRLRVERLHERRVPLAAPGIWALAAVVLLALSAVLLRSHRAPAPDLALASPPACAERLTGLWRIDVAGLRAPLPAAIPRARLSVGHDLLTIPALLVARGPYDAAVGQAAAADGAVCVPLLAPYGEVLVLSVTRTEAAADDGAAFRAVSDPMRVLYTRVAWTHGGQLWRLEGRAPVADLQALAQEIAAGTQRGS